MLISGEKALPSDPDIYNTPIQYPPHQKKMFDVVWSLCNVEEWAPVRDQPGRAPRHQQTEN